MTVTSRDIAILNFVFRVDGCSIEHLLRRFFPTYQAGRYGPTTSAYHRVRQLIEANYLAAQRLPALSGIGSGKRFLSIGSGSYALLAEQLEIPRRELHRARHTLTPFAALHHLAIVDFLLSLELATAENPAVTVEEWVSERELRQSPFRVKDPKSPQTIVLIPDGAFTLALPDGSDQAFYLEMDMGTVSPKRLRAKLRGYLVQRATEPRPILWVVPDGGRQQAIVRWALQEARALTADPTIFWVTTTQQVHETTILAPIFQVASVSEPLSLVPASPSLPRTAPLPQAEATFPGGARL